MLEMNKPSRPVKKEGTKGAGAKRKTAYEKGAEPERKTRYVGALRAAVSITCRKSPAMRQLSLIKCKMGTYAAMSGIIKAERTFISSRV